MSGFVCFPENVPVIFLYCREKTCCIPLIQAINAAPYGVLGVLVYTEPLDINDGLMSDINETYPHSWYMPPSGVERGSYGTDYGDPLTPYLAAKGDLAIKVCPCLFIGGFMPFGSGTIAGFTTPSCFNDSFIH